MARGDAGQRAAIRFARRAQGDGVELRHRARHLVFRQPGRGEGAHFVEVQIGAVVGDDEGRRQLAPAIVRHAHHNCLGDGGVVAQHRLDLGGIDVLPAGDDEILGTPLDGVKAFGVHGDEVSRVEPSVV